MNGPEPVFELSDGRLAVERLDLTTHEHAGPTDGFLVPGPLNLLCGFARHAIEEPLGDPNTVVLRKRESVVEDLLGRRSHAPILRARKPVGYLSTSFVRLVPRSKNTQAKTEHTNKDMHLVLDYLIRKEKAGT